MSSDNETANIPGTVVSSCASLKTVVIKQRFADLKDHENWRSAIFPEDANPLIQEVWETRVKRFRIDTIHVHPDDVAAFSGLCVHPTEDPPEMVPLKEF